LTAVVTAGITYGVSLTSDLLWKSPSPHPKFLLRGARRSLKFPDCNRSSKDLAPSPDAQGSKIPPSVAETTKILPPETAKSPAPMQKIAPPSPEGGSSQNHRLLSPRYGGPDRKGAPAPLASGSPTKVPSLSPVQPPAGVPARKSTPFLLRLAPRQKFLLCRRFSVRSGGRAIRGSSPNPPGRGLSQSPPPK